mmetsp:Transcript_52230/g.150379  ORF Transcript_52230/g.150379 Transcript_52230/m.150379 type:complete len:218 (-) Transcript_52230:236-889(-)
MMSTLCFARKSARPSWPGSSSTVKLQRSMIRKFGLAPLSRSSAAPSMSRLKPRFNSGAPPVMSRVLTLGDCRKRCKHRSTTSSDIISLRSGEDSTWQWLQAWLQYKPTLSCKTLQGPRSKSEMLARSLMNLRKGGAPTFANALARWSHSSLGATDSAWRMALDSSRSSRASGIKLVRWLASRAPFPQISCAALVVICVMSTGPYSNLRCSHQLWTDR